MMIEFLVVNTVLNTVLLIYILIGGHTMAQDQAALDAAIKALSDIDTQTLAAVTAEDAGLAALITAVNALIAKIKGGATAADLTNEVTAVNSLTSGLTPVVADLTTQTANIQAAVAAAKAITG